MILQLNPTIPMETPMGKALAHFLIDYGEEHDLYWVCFQDETGECWTWNNKQIRIQNNISFGRTHVEKPYSRETSASALDGTGRTGYSVGQSWTTIPPVTGLSTRDIVTSFQTGYSFTRNDMTTS